MVTIIRLLIAALILLVSTNVSGSPHFKTAAVVYGFYQAGCQITDAKRLSTLDLDSKQHAELIVKRTLKRLVLYYEIKFIIKFIYYSVKNNPEIIDEIKNLGKDVKKTTKPGRHNFSKGENGASQQSPSRGAG